jgi:hypothetical protein
MTSTATKSAMPAEGSQSGSLLPLAVMLISRVAAYGYAASGTARARASAEASVARMQRSA